METISYTCKICGMPFSYATLPLKLRLEEGESAPERCDICRRRHNEEIRRWLRIPFLTGVPRSPTPSPFLMPLGQQTFHGNRSRQTHHKEPECDKTKLGIDDNDILSIYDALDKYRVVVLVSTTGSGKSTFVPSRLVEPPPGYSVFVRPTQVRRERLSNWPG